MGMQQLLGFSAVRHFQEDAETRPFVCATLGISTLTAGACCFKFWCICCICQSDLFCHLQPAPVEAGRDGTAGFESSLPCPAHHPNTPHSTHTHVIVSQREGSDLWSRDSCRECWRARVRPLDMRTNLSRRDSCRSVRGQNLPPGKTWSPYSCSRFYQRDSCWRFYHWNQQLQ